MYNLIQAGVLPNKILCKNTASYSKIIMVNSLNIVLNKTKRVYELILLMWSFKYRFGSTSALNLTKKHTWEMHVKYNGKEECQ